ncbi:transglutaminase domain-containing protein [Thermostilla marina]
MVMTSRRFAIGAFLGICLAGLAAPSVFAQFKTPEEAPGGAVLAEPVVQRWKAGIIITATGGPCRNVVATAPIPRNWPEQEVEIEEEDFSEGIRVRYQNVDNLVDQMVVTIPSLNTGEEARAVVILKIRRYQIYAPEDTSVFKIPASASEVDRSAVRFLSPSPKIESTDRKIRDKAKEILPAEGTDWEKVEAIYDFVREHVTYEQNAPLRGAIYALEHQTGDCEDMTSLFIALCRASGIPARTVWVPGHCYPEFYLNDAEGNGHWFPCQVAGSRAFGEMPQTLPILQKGDNFRSPVNPRERIRYLYETARGARLGGQPRITTVRELLPE